MAEDKIVLQCDNFEDPNLNNYYDVLTHNFQIKSLERRMTEVRKRNNRCRTGTVMFTFLNLCHCMSQFHSANDKVMIFFYFPQKIGFDILNVKIFFWEENRFKNVC